MAAATLDLAEEHGLAAVTVEQIAARAGVSYRTFFNYFSAKEEALLRPTGGGGSTFGAHLLAQDASLAPLDAARAALHEELSALEDDGAAWHRRLTVIAQDETLLPRLVQLGATNEREMAEAIATRLGQDVERDLYPGLLGAVLGCAVRVTLTRWHRLEGRTPLPRLLDEALDALAAGLPGARPAGS
nr:TetR family transcriptional regulator [Blastococcus saxobsidens]